MRAIRNLMVTLAILFAASVAWASGVEEDLLAKSEAENAALAQENADLVEANASLTAEVATATTAKDAEQAAHAETRARLDEKHAALEASQAEVEAWTSEAVAELLVPIRQAALDAVAAGNSAFQELAGLIGHDAAVAAVAAELGVDAEALAAVIDALSGSSE